MDDRDLVVVIAESNRVGMESPLGYVRERMEEGMEGWPWSHKWVLEPSGQRLGGSVILDERFGVDVTEEGSNRGPLSFGEHGDLPLSDLFDPLGRLKKCTWPWNDEGWVIPIVFNVSFWGYIEGLLIVFDLVFQPKDAAVEAVLLNLMLLGVLVDSGCQPLGNVGGECVIGMFDEVEGGKGGMRRERTWDPLGVVEHIHHSRQFRDGEW